MPTPTSTRESASARTIGRYALFDEIASGGMATVHLGRLIGSAGFTRTVAIKRLHANYAKDPDFVAMFLDEARLAARIQHPNVVPTLDVVPFEGELYLVMEYVQGESFARLHRQVLAKGERVPLAITLSVMDGVLHGLHAAHEAKSERGEPLGIVHRDVSPQNIQVGTDGVARVLDFGVAKAAWRQHTTRDGQLKGKLAYMAPEQFADGAIDRRVDVYAASVILWEALTGQRLFEAESPMVIMTQITSKAIPRPSEIVPALPKALDDVVMRGLCRRRDDRWPTARAMAIALETFDGASRREVGEWVEHTVGDALLVRARKVAEVEGVSTIIARPSANMSAAIPPGAAATVAPSVDAPLDANAAQASVVTTPTLQAVNESLTTGAAERTRARTSMAPWSVLVALLVGGAVVAVVMLAMRAPRESLRANTVASTLLTFAYGAAADAAANEAQAAVAAATSAMATSGAMAATAASTSSSASADKPTARPTAPPLRPRAAPPKPDCSPPYTVDAKGIRRPKLQCL